MRSSTHSARASCHSQLRVVMQEHTEHVGGSVASISGLLVDKFVGFNHRDVGTIVVFSLMPVVPPKPTGIMHVLGHASRMFSMELERKAAQCLSSPGSGFFSCYLLYSPENPREVKAENPTLKTYTGKDWNLEHQGCGQL